MAEVDVDGDTFAACLAKALMAQRGFSAVLLPAIEAFAFACDRVLVQSGQHAVQGACIVDRDARPDATFGLAPDEVLAIGEAWAEDVRRSGHRRRPMSVTIYEVGAGVVTAEAERRLAAYRIPRSFGRIPAVQAVFVDPERRAVLVWVVLGAVLRNEVRPDEARAAMAPTCAAETAGALHDAPGRLQLCR